jgi:predicted nuclease of predicted toxin-antitoxin system
MRFLIDANISPKIAGILRILDVDATALIEEFPADISDIDLFQRLTGSDWIFVTSDRMIKRRTAEAKAL